MAYTSNKQTQFELFPGAGPEKEPQAPKSARIFKDLTLSQENIIVITIIFVVSMVLFFSLGVERGKRVALKDVSEKLATLKVQAPKPEKPVVDEEPVQKISIKHEVKPVKTETVEDKREVLEIKFDEDLRYTIQVASFKKSLHANEEAKTLESKGHQTFVMPKGKYQIVCVGRFAEKSEADQYAKQLSGRYGDYYIRRL